jgi:flagella basal body P-ring formation protein FlgA
MKRAPVMIFAVVIAICTALVDTAMAAELRLRTDARPQGGVVRLGDVADILSGGESEIQSLAQIELTTAPTPGKQRIISAREIQDTLERRGINMLAHHISGASQVTVVGYVEPIAKAGGAKAKTLAYSTVQEAKRTVTAAIVRCLQQANGSDDPWTADFELTDAQAQAVLADVHHVEASGGEAPWVGHQKFDIQVHTEKGPVVFTIEAQVGMPSAVVVTTVAVPRGEILSETDVTLQRVKPDAQIGDAFQSLEDVVGREAVLAIAPGQILDPQYIRTPVMVKRGSVVTVVVQAPGVKLRTTGRAREDGSKGDSINIESLLERKTYLAKVVGIDQVEITTTASTMAEDAINAKPEQTTTRKIVAKQPRATVARTNRGDDADPNTSGNRFQ